VGTPPLEPKHSFTRRRFLTLTAASLGGLALYAGEISRHELSIEQPTIHLARLPDAFRGMRIVQISDFHYDEFTEPYFLREMVREVNRLRADMVVLTGDFVSLGPLPRSFGQRKAPECAALLSAIECPLRYAILGNHDCLVGSRYVVEALKEHGIPTLENSAVPLERDGQRLWLAGLGSACDSNSHPEVALPRAVQSGGEPVIVLSHEPDVLPNVARFNVDLMLSGHTHGGQVRLPFLPPIALPEYGRHYTEGLFRHGSTQLYVNRGIGTVGLPFRFRCPPEITVITLA
jgi:predicted MPP superfamily phosphohydrolase